MGEEMIKLVGRGWTLWELQD